MKNFEKTEPNNQDTQQGEAMEHLIEEQEASQEKTPEQNQEQISNPEKLKEIAEQSKQELLDALKAKTGLDQDSERLSQIKEELGSNNQESAIEKDQANSQEQIKSLEETAFAKQRDYVEAVCQEKDAGLTDEIFEKETVDPETGETKIEMINGVNFLSERMAEIDQAKVESLGEKKKNWFSKKWESWKNSSQEKKAKVYKKLIKGGVIGGAVAGGAAYGAYLGHQLIVKTAESLDSMCSLLEML